MGDAPTTQVLSLDAAISINTEVFPETHAQFQDWIAALRQQHQEHDPKTAQAEDLKKLFHAVEMAATIGSATFSSRYGVGDKLSAVGFPGYDCLHYHNTQHSLDILARIDHITEHYGFEKFPVRRRILLMLFALFHDLRQQESGEVTNGVGANERLSANEACSIIHSSLTLAGFDAIRDAPLFEYFKHNMRLMIFGTTFGFVSRTEPMTNPYTKETKDLTVPVGALAPLVVDIFIDGHPRWQESKDKVEIIENIKLGADVDTANVSDSFYDFAVQGVNLCREIEKRKGNLICDAAAVYGFMTGGQEYYFNVAQRYNSQYSKDLLLAAKARNKDKLSALTARVRQRFGDPEDQGKSLGPNFLSQDNPLLGDDIMATYLDGAKQLSD